MASTKSKDLAVILAPFAGGQQKLGVDKAPSALLEAGLPDHLTDLGYSITTTNLTEPVNAITTSLTDNDPPHRQMRNPRLVSAVTHQISKQVYDHALQSRIVLTLGGDCSIKLGTLSGVASATRSLYGIAAEIGVVYVDAHADINTPETSPSGNVHGMPLAFLTGIAESDDPEVLGWLSAEHRVSVGKVVYIALRDVDDAEQRFIDEYGIKFFGMDQIKQLGLEEVMKQVLYYLGTATKIHLSWDIDAFDPSVAPSTGFPTPNGLSLEEGRCIAKMLGETGKVVAVDLSEINPEIGSEADVKKTVNAGMEVVKAVLGA